MIRTAGNVVKIKHTNIVVCAFALFTVDVLIISKKEIIQPIESAKFSRKVRRKCVTSKCGYGQINYSFYTLSFCKFKKIWLDQMLIFLYYVLDLNTLP